jgi:hypothetical protein
MGGEAAPKQIYDETRRLGLAAELDTKQWASIRQRLLDDPRVVEGRTNGVVRLIEDPFRKERSLPPREALEYLATPSTKRPKGLTTALQEAVQTGQSELTAYERVAAHALKATLRPWQTAASGYTPHGVSPIVLARAVEFLADVTKGQRRSNNPTTEPSSKLSKKGAPPASEITPLLVGLVTTPEDSDAANQAAELPRGLSAQACVMAIMSRFETEDCTVGGGHLLRRATVLLSRACEATPLIPAGQSEAFAGELLERALALIPRAAGQQLPSDPECQWVNLVLAALPEHAIRRGIAAVGAEDLAAALDVLPDRPEGGRAEAERILASLASTHDDTEQRALPKGAASDDVEPAEPTPVDPAPSESGPASDADAAPAPPAPLVTEEQGPEAAAHAPEDSTVALLGAAEPTHVERSHHEAALSRERAVAHALRSERDQVQQELAAVGRRLDRTREENDELRAQLVLVTAELASVNRRAEALTVRAQRRDQELRQARQGARTASQSQLRQARIDGLRVLATVLVEVADQAAHATDDSDPSRALYRRALAQAGMAGLVDIGVSGEETDFDPSRHQAPTGSADRVVVERPGFAWQAGGAQEEVVLLPALVRRAGA